MARSSLLRRDTALAFGLATLALAAACSSTSDDSSPPSNTAGAGGMGGKTSSGGTANGASGHGGTGSAGTAGGAHAGSAGKAGSAGTGGAAGAADPGAGGMSGEAGASNGSAGTNSGTAGEAGANNTGSELVYVVGLGAGVSEFQLGEGGKPQPLADGVVKADRGFPYGIAVSPDQRFLYTIQDDAKLRAYALDDRGALSKDPIATVDAGDAGTTPEAITLAKDGKFIYVGDSAGIDIFAVDTSTGVPTKTGAPPALAVFPQFLVLSPDGKTIYATEPAFGIHGFQVNAETGALTELQGSPFAKNVFPRGGVAITPNGKFMYASGTGLNAISIAADGSLTSIATYTDDVLTDNYASNVAITEDSRFVYATQFLTKQPSGTGFGLFSGFSIETDGTLKLLDGFPVPVNNAYSVGIDPSSRFLFVGMDDLDLFSVFSIAANGSVSPIDGSPFTAHGFEPLFAFALRP